MTYSDHPDHVPADWIAAGYLATEEEIDAILGPDFDRASPTGEAVAAGRVDLVVTD